MPLNLIEFAKAPLAQRHKAGVGSRFFAASDEGSTYFDTGFEWWMISGPDYASVTAQEYIPAYSFVTRQGRVATAKDELLGFTLKGGEPGKPITVYLNGTFANPDWEWTSGQPLYWDGAQINGATGSRAGTALGADTMLVAIADKSAMKLSDLDKIGVLGGQVGILGGNVAYYN